MKFKVLPKDFILPHWLPCLCTVYMPVISTVILYIVQDYLVQKW